MATLRWFGTFVGLLIIVVLVAVSIPGSRIQSRGYLVKTRSNARQLIVSMKIFAEDHDGRFPNELSELEATGVIDTEALKSILGSAWSHSEPPKPLDWIYLPPSEKKSPLDQPILISPLIVDTRSKIIRDICEFFGFPPSLPQELTRIVGTADGDVQIMHENAFQNIARKHHLTIRHQSPP